MADADIERIPEPDTESINDGRALVPPTQLRSGDVIS